MTIMQIYLATYMGMCRGLRLILHRTNREVREPSGNDIYLFKNLVHNHQAHKHLLDLGVKAQLFNPDDIPDNSRVIVGPHSAPPSVLRMISERATLIDTSCKFVLKVLVVAKELSKEGYCVVFIGNSNHEEAEMIENAIPDSFILSSENDIDKLPSDKPLGLVSQSTQTLERYLKFAELIKASGRKVKIGMTVCQETHKRQSAVIDLAKRVNKMIVIGGNHSNNTIALTETARKYTTTWQVETADELNPDWFEFEDKVGITAGASTPDTIVDSIVNRLQEINLDVMSKDTSITSNKLRWNIVRMRTSISNIFFSMLEWVQHLRGRNPTDI